jgi:hypothetical protein
MVSNGYVFIDRNVTQSLNLIYDDPRINVLDYKLERY